MECVLCREAGGDLVWQDDACRVVRVGGREGDDNPGYCRVIFFSNILRKVIESPRAISQR